MRTLIVTNLSSIDGHYEGPGANVITASGRRWSTIRRQVTTKRR